MLLICGQVLSSVFADHRHVTFDYNRYLAGGQPYRVVKIAGLNLSPFITRMSALSRIGVTRRLGYNYFPVVVLHVTTGKWIKGGSPRILVNVFAGRPDVFC